jgi:hypothetical protein
MKWGVGQSHRGSGSGLESAISACSMSWEKSQVPEEVPQSPWPQVWGCGMESRPWHPPCGSPEEFPSSPLSHIFHFLRTFLTQQWGPQRGLNFHLLWRLLDWRFWCWFWVLKIFSIIKIRNTERSNFNRLILAKSSKNLWHTHSSLPLKLVHCVTRNKS